MSFNRNNFENLRIQLENESSSFLPTWRELGDFILPRRTRFSSSDVNKDERRTSKIIDSTATLAQRTLRSGMMSGLTSPARPWFKLTLRDSGTGDLSEPAKFWLDEVTKAMTTIFLKSNLYNKLPIIYGDLGVFGNGALYMEEDIDEVVRFSSFSIGEYNIGVDFKGVVDKFIRTFSMTVHQIVVKYGQEGDVKNPIDWSKISSHARSMYENNLKEAYIEVRHVVMPNPQYDSKKLESKYKKFISVYYESGATGTAQYGPNYFNTTGGGLDLNKYLSEKGYDYFPVLVPRWEVSSEDTYATSCPGIIALGDIKQLQIGEKRSNQAIEKMVNPPMIAPTSMRNQKASILPGDITYTDERDGQKGFRAAHDINFRVDLLEQKQEQVRQRIKRAFYEDLFLMFALSDRREITATEVNEKQEEKLLALGPVLEQLNQDLLDPLIDNTFLIMGKQNLIPEPPPELQGRELKVEYLSVMAQAQKLTGLGTIERFAGFYRNILEIEPGVAAKVNTDNLMDRFADRIGLDPGIVRDDEAAEEIRAAQQAQIQQQQQAEQAQMTARATKDLSQSPINGRNALEALAGAEEEGQVG